MRTTHIGGLIVEGLGGFCGRLKTSSSKEQRGGGGEA